MSKPGTPASSMVGTSGADRSAPLIGNMSDVAARYRLHQFARKVLHAAVSGGGEGEAAGFRFCEPDELFHGPRLYRGMNDQDEGRESRQRDGRQILERIVGHPGVEALVDGHFGD